MKKFKHIFLALFLVTAFSCEEDEVFQNFAQDASAPENIGALMTVTQDNSGLVSITPYGDGASSFQIEFGDGSEISETMGVGSSAEHTYSEGDYTVNVHAMNSAGKKTTEALPLSVSFQAPMITQFDVAADPLVSNGVQVTVNADYAVTFDIQTGAEGMSDIVDNQIGSTVSFAYDTQGTYTITVIVKGGAIETTSDTFEFTSVEIQSPVISAPDVPNRNSSDYLAIYAQDYEELTGIDFYPNWGQSTLFSEYDLDGDKMLQYSNMNYQGVDFGGPQDVSGFEFLHFDLWTPDMASIQVYAISSSTGEQFIDVPMTASEWTSVDIPLQSFIDKGLSMSDIFQFKFVDAVGGGQVFMDNIYFYASAPSAPVTAAPAPGLAAGAVISVSSSHYTDITSTEWNPDWGQSTVLSSVDLEGIPTLKYEMMNYTGIVLDYGNPTDISSMDYVHFNYWTADAESIGFKTVNTSMPDGATKESEVVVSDVTYGEWVSVSIPLSEYTTDPTGITQLVLSSSGGTVYMDNIIFYKEVADAPTLASPTPTEDAANVVSIFSPSYTAIGVSEWNPDWGQTTVLSTVQVDGKDVLKYEALNYSGLVLDYGAPTDLTGKTHVHIDFWTPNASSLGFKIVNTSMPDGPTKEAEVAAAPTIPLGEWVSVDIPLSSYSTDLSGVTQLLFSADDATVYIGNLYFY
ncbi:hypothetical protein N9L20_08200 [Flavobacteriaceae bacterium]|nr:hypothetical protein [Flavobacteriaceae bacterium]